MLEYAAALEEHFTALQMVAYVESSAVGQTVVRNFAASATTIHSNKSTLIEEFRVYYKEQAAYMSSKQVRTEVPVDEQTVSK